MKWLAVAANLAIVWMLIWTLYFLGLLKPIH